MAKRWAYHRELGLLNFEVSYRYKYGIVFDKRIFGDKILEALKRTDLEYLYEPEIWFITIPCRNRHRVNRNLSFLYAELKRWYPFYVVKFRKENKR